MSGQPEGTCTSSVHIMVLVCDSWLCLCSGVSSSARYGINAGAAHADDVFDIAFDVVASVVVVGDGEGVGVGACRRSRSTQN